MIDCDDGENDESGDDYTEEEAMTGADEDQLFACLCHSYKVRTSR